MKRNDDISITKTDAKTGQAVTATRPIREAIAEAKRLAAADALKAARAEMDSRSQMWLDGECGLAYAQDAAKIYKALVAKQQGA